MVPFEDTFITVGGDNVARQSPADTGNGYTDKVWQLKSDMTWEELQHLRLVEAKAGVTDMLASST